MKPLALPLVEMVRLYEGGSSLREVGAAVGCSSVTAFHHLRRLGVKMRQPGRPKGYKMQSKLNHAEIAREIGVPAETVATVASAVVERLMGRR